MGRRPGRASSDARGPDRASGGRRESRPAMEAGRRPWLAEIAVAEADDGGGYGLPELAVVLENLGREGYGGPLLSCAVAAPVIRAHGPRAHPIALLPGPATQPTRLARHPRGFRTGAGRSICR